MKIYLNKEDFTIDCVEDGKDLYYSTEEDFNKVIIFLTN